MRKNFFLNLSLIFLFITLLVMSLQFLNTRSIKSHSPEQNAYLTWRFQWLDSVNLYLKTGKILMLPENNRLEDLAVGEDQGYPFILSILGRSLGMKEMTFSAFVKFNYLLVIALGVATSVLFFLAFKSLLVSNAFYYLYLRIAGIYGGGVDHHWMLGVYIPFYLAFLIFYLRFRTNFKRYWLGFYFLVAGIANMLREGDGVIGLLIFFSLLTIIIIQEDFKKFIPKPILTSLFSYLGRNVFLIVFLTTMYLLPTLLLIQVRNSRNLRYFEGKSSDMITHHGIWHVAFMGLGYIPNDYGIQVDDTNPIKFAHKVNPDIKYMTNEYFDILRALYFKYSFESPNLWFGNVLIKLEDTHELSATFFSQITGNFLPNTVGNFVLYFLLSSIFLLSYTNKISTTIFWTIFSSLIITSIPGLIVAPSYFYTVGFQAALLMTLFYLFIIFYLKLKKFFGSKWTTKYSLIRFI